MKIPRTVNDVTPEWLTDVFRERGTIHDAVVRSFDITALEGGFNGTVHRLSMEYSTPQTMAPDTVVIKLPHVDEAWRKLTAEKGFYERETRFYAELVESINVRTPIVYRADMDLFAGDHVLLLEDFQHLRAGDQVLGCTEEDARGVMHYLAALHSRWWNDDRLDSMPWLMHAGGVQYSEQTAALYAKGVEPGLERLSDWLPPGIESMARLLVPAIPWFFKTVSSGPLTLCHRDFRLGNLFFSNGDSGDVVEVAAIDWEQVGAQRGAPEVAYFMCWSFDTEDRRRIEPGLLEEYHAGLLTGGVHDYSYGNFILDYRTGLLRNLITLMVVVGNLPEDRYRDDVTNSAIFKPMAIRMQTLIDWECGELIPD